MLNYARLFYTSSTVETDRFENRIEPDPGRLKQLERAKDLIREHLRLGIKEATVSVLQMDEVVEPKFRSQGSQRYKLCLDPAHQPPQEIDWDYGVYLPVRVWKESGPPGPMAKLYFNLVETLLQQLCKQQGWELDRGKDNCVRVRIAKWGHVDVPLYAASKVAFDRVTERAAVSRSLRKSASSATEIAAANAALAAGELIDQEWDDLTDVVMATRTGEWKKTDPEVVTRWFLDRVKQHGPQLRRVCRYVKAWRDYHWPKGGPTSVSLMIAVTQKFERFDGRDDLALQRAARVLTAALRGDIREAAIDKGVEDFNRLDPAGRAEAGQRADALLGQLQAARQRKPDEAGTAIAFITAQLGQRIPNRPELVEPDSSEAVVRSVPAGPVVLPMVPPTKAGKAG
jgi:hypothetical protein